MIAVDTNLLIFAHRGDSVHNETALAALQPVFEGTSAWALPWPCVHEFISIATNPGIYQPASKLSEALGFLESLFGSPQLHLLSEGPGYFDRLRELTLAAKLSGPRIHDARVAALCLHHGVSELWSADRDFSAFPRLKVRNPLVKK
jgi:uncharacterized protein